MTRRWWTFASFAIVLADALACCALASPLPGRALVTLAAHGVLAAALGLVSFRLARPGEAVALGWLAVVVAGFVPVFGGLLVIVAVHASRLGTARRAVCGFERLDLQEESVGGARESPGRAPSPPSFPPVVLAGELRDRSPGAADRRFQALLRACALPRREAVALLKIALSDPNDEHRLFAFSRIEAWRSEIERGIRRREAAIASSSPLGAARLEGWLAESYWELAYLDLAEGAVRHHVLEAALDHAGRSRAAPVIEAAAAFLIGRVRLRLGDPAAAAAAFEDARRLGFPSFRVLPYLAECAFRRRVFDEVRALVRAFDAETAQRSALRPVVETWR